jgi:hypothetical protein
MVVLCCTPLVPRVRVIRKTHPQRSEPFQGPRILVIVVEATRAIVVIGIDSSGLLEDCPAIASGWWCDQAEKERMEVGSEFATWEAWLCRVHAHHEHHCILDKDKAGVVRACPIDGRARVDQLEDESQKSY